jgi:hypothetical protein
MSDAFMTAHRAHVISLAAHHRIPAVYPRRLYPEHGRLLSCGSYSLENYRQAASYEDRILRGTKPGELPIQMRVKFARHLQLHLARREQLRQMQLSR